jgi:hypothetical protein
LGHCSVCLLLHGHIRLLSSSLFRCDVRSGWIDPAGPAGNLLMGTLALVATQFVPSRFAGVRLFFIVVTAFSCFWEGGYVIRAMHQRDGDLYFFMRFLLGEPAVWERWAAALVGLVLFVFTIRLTARALLRLWPDAATARSVARTVWIGATMGAGLARWPIRVRAGAICGMPSSRSVQHRSRCCSYPLVVQSLPQRSRPHC